ncbi:MmcQ/YjbR family DNA-binding protein [Leifsonia kafniensis]|uniref:MmcQ/YjbR family DNA-binding protein n=1 Tax=Leifsonia kafniensis TaxID=475957 RepID=A0ABP7KMX5_9MICO
MALPESSEVPSWGRPSFRVGSGAGSRIFAVVGTHPNLPHTLVFKPDIEERRALIEDARFFSPPYAGAGGWLAIGIDPPKIDWVELAELIETSYRQVALKRQVALLGTRPSR